MGASAFRAYKQGDNTQFMNLIHRDGVLVYIYLLVVTIANLTCMIVLPHEFQVMLVPAQAAIYSVLTARIVINIRAFGIRGTDGAATALHDEYESLRPGLIPLEFRLGTKPLNSMISV